MFCTINSYYSLRYGILSVNKLVNLAHEHDFSAIAITDINTTTGVFECLKQAQKNNIKPIIGVECRDKNNQWLYTLLAKNINGFFCANEFVSAFRLKDESLPAVPPFFDDVITIFPNSMDIDLLHNNQYLAIRPFELNICINFSQSKLEKCVLLPHVVLECAVDIVLHKHLRAIDTNKLLSQSDLYDVTDSRHVFLSVKDLNANKIPKELLQNNKKIEQTCCVDINLKTSKNKQKFSHSFTEDIKMLREKSFLGLKKRFGEKASNYTERLEKELKVIIELNYTAYFLIAYDLVRYTMQKNIYHVGRGSGANSLVAYCLYITDVNPIELNLYFERFINPKRSSPPDFDIDFSWKDRDTAYQYLFDKYGPKHIALLGTINTFKNKSIYRELCKVYGLPKDEIDKFIENPSQQISEQDTLKKIIEIGNKLQSFPNIRSIHAGGVLISEQPITMYSILDMPPKGLPTVQFDMYMAEEIGFEKFDILSQRGIGHINECIETVKKTKNLALNIHDINTIKNDSKSIELLEQGKTLGCFYIESPAMRALLTKLKCDSYSVLVAASSVIRPGVAKSGMMKTYIKRHLNIEKTTYLHQVLKELLHETYGVMVYQEDVLRVCAEYAGMDMADADILRRAMSGKFRSKKEFERIVDVFFSNSKAIGRPEKTTQELWRQISSFAGYSFSKAHSASYAVESFQSLYLKAHFPLHFITAVLNNFGGYYSASVYFNEAKKLGAIVHLPCINYSILLNKLIGKQIYIGFIYIANLNKKIIKNIINEREKNGFFISITDFMRRIFIGIEDVVCLIRAGAFGSFNKTKATMIWEARMYNAGNKSKQTQLQPLLFDIPEQNIELPQFDENKLQHAYDELELFGFPITISWFEMLRTNYRGDVFAHQMDRYHNKTVKMVGWLATKKYVYTSKKDIMIFGTFLDKNGDFFDTVHFPDSLSKYPFTGNGVYLILGKVVVEFKQPTIEVAKFAKLPLNQNLVHIAKQK